MKLRFLYGILLAIAISKAEGDGSTGKVADNPDLGIVAIKESRGNEGRSLNDDGDHSADGGLKPTLEDDDSENGGRIVFAADDNSEDSSTDTPMTKDSSSDTTTTKDSSSDTPTTKDSSSDTPTTKDSSSDTPTTKDSSSDTPTTKDSSSDTPTTKDSSSDTPTTKDSSSDTPTTKDSSSDTPTTKDSSSDTPTTKETSSTNKATTQSTSTIASTEEYPYQVRGENGTCILSKMTISLILTYNNEKNQISKKTLNVPSDNVTTSGMCEETNSTMELAWFSDATTSEFRSVGFATNVNNITFYFKKDDSKFSINQIEAYIYLDEKNFPDALERIYVPLKTKSDLSLFITSTNDKYVCNEKVFVTEEKFELLITDVSLIAFNTDNISSRSVNNCVNPLTETANVGAIVGGVIGALAVIGIIGFVIWRRRRNAPVPEGDGSTGKVADNSDLGIVAIKESRGNEGRSLNDDGDHSADGGLKPTLEDDDSENGGRIVFAIDDNSEDSSTDTTTTKGTSTDTTTTKDSSSDTTTTKDTSTDTPTTKDSSSDTTTTKDSSSDTPTTKDSSSDTPTTKETSSTNKATTPSTSTIASTEEYPYQVRGENGICILSKMTISLNVTYNITDTKDTSILNIQSSDVTTGGYCSEPVSVMELTWEADFSNGKRNNITFYLKKDDKSTFSVFEILVMIHLDSWNFPNATDADILQTTGPNLRLFAASATNGKYTCNIETKVRTETVEISITDVDLIAFNTDKDISSRSVEDCVPKPNIVETFHFNVDSIGAIVIPITAVIIICAIACTIWLQKRNPCLYLEDNFCNNVQ
ncbi:lysosome-associated membrane glycoprotein 1-like [Vespula squamosa]|uniref:Lysosome-associated membrane glycoprotein 1-like n=1 Tax=Vespula squamosa TaxID=30214 RepID=A0ABD2C1G9_VESSQ